MEFSLFKPDREWHEETKKLFKRTMQMIFIFILLCIFLLFLAKIFLPPHFLPCVGVSDVSSYGYLGLFIITLLGGTFFPAGSPAVVAAAGAVGFSKILVMFISATGYTLGTCINYYLAYKFGIPYVQKKIGKEVYYDLLYWWNKWGPVLVISFALLPILPFNLLALLCGLFRFNLLCFILINFGSNLMNSYLFVYVGISAAQWMGIC